MWVHGEVMRGRQGNAEQLGFAKTNVVNRGWPIIADIAPINVYPSDGTFLLRINRVCFCMYLEHRIIIHIVCGSSQTNPAARIAA